MLAYEGSNPSPSARISPILSTQPAEDLLNRAAACIPKKMLGDAARLGTIVPKGGPRARSRCRSGLPQALGTSTMRNLAPVGCYERQRSRVHCFPVYCL